jgi:hypothetical protein
MRHEGRDPNQRQIVDRALHKPQSYRLWTPVSILLCIRVQALSEPPPLTPNPAIGGAGRPRVLAVLAAGRAERFALGSCRLIGIDVKLALQIAAVDVAVGRVGRTAETCAIADVQNRGAAGSCVGSAATRKRPWGRMLRTSPTAKRCVSASNASHFNRPDAQSFSRVAAKRRTRCGTGRLRTCRRK